MNLSRFPLLSIFALAAVVAGTVSAEEATKREHSGLSLTLGGTLNDGNTEDESANLSVDFDQFSGGIEYKLGAAGNITRTASRKTSVAPDGTATTRKEKDTTVKNGEVSGKAIFPVRGPLSAYFDASAFADEIADVDFRFIAGPGLAVDICKTGSFLFAVELGLSPMWEKIAGESEYYTMARAGERLEYAFAGGAKVWQSCKYLPALEDSDKYLVNAEAGVESPLNDRLSLRLVALDRYNSLPDDGCEKNDLSLMAGIRVKL